MNIIKKIKLLLKLKDLISEIRENKNMKDLVKTSAGWLKIIGYVAVAISLGMGFMDAKTALIITVGLSALVKFSETVVGLTTSTADDEFVLKVKEILAKYNLLK